MTILILRNFLYYASKKQIIKMFPKENPNFSELDSSKLKIKYFKNILDCLSSVDLPFSLPNDQDIINEIYEGGFKVWECTTDLIDFFKNEKNSSILKNAKILDVGCGQGILGILGLKYDADFILFQDYNVEVLKYCALPNIKVNFENDWTSISKKIAFVSGDWMTMHEKIEKNMNEIPLNNEEIVIPKVYDVLLMSEVIYRKENYEKIAHVIVKNMKKEGVCFLASKVYYFGVGGSLPEFELFLQNNYPFLEWVQVSEIKNKKSNNRKIIEIKYKNI